jgi:tRNA threonylcarbamoyl adenosine modification protein YjeE
MAREVFEFEGPRGRLRAVARAIGAAAQGGDVVALEGALGAGKTVFAQALARGAGVPERQRVASPTFAIVQEYRGRLRVLHADLYRLSGPEALSEVGLFSTSEDALTVVEWPERADGELPSSALWVRIERIAPLRRRVRVEGEGPRALALIDAAKRGFTARGARASASRDDR